MGDELINETDTDCPLACSSLSTPTFTLIENDEFWTCRMLFYCQQKFSAKNKMLCLYLNISAISVWTSLFMDCLLYTSPSPRD